MTIAAIVGLMLFVAQAGAAAQPSGGHARGQSAGAAAITQVADAYVKASLAGDAKAIADLYTEDAVEMPPNQPLHKGRAAIQQYYEKLFASGVKLSAFTLDHIETRATGESAYDVGTYRQSMTPPGGSGPSSESGKYVVIMKRTGGIWKVAYAIYNSDQPPPGAGR